MASIVLAKWMITTSFLLLLLIVNDNLLLRSIDAFTIPSFSKSSSSSSSSAHNKVSPHSSASFFDSANDCRLFMVASLDKTGTEITTGTNNNDNKKNNNKRKKTTIRTFRFPNSTIDNDLLFLEDEWNTRGPSFFFDFPKQHHQLEEDLSTSLPSTSTVSTTTSISISMPTSPIVQEEQPVQYDLELDGNVGQLRLSHNGPILLDGIGKLSATTSTTSSLLRTTGVLSAMTEKGEHRWVALPPASIMDDNAADDTTHTATRTTIKSVASSSSSSSSSYSSIFLQAKLPLVKEEAQSAEYYELDLGQLLPSTDHRIMGCSRINRYWMGPSFGSGSSTSDEDGDRRGTSVVPHDTQFLLAEIRTRQDNFDSSSSTTTDNSDDDEPLYALILPMVDSGFRATIQTYSTSTSTSISKASSNNNNNDRLKVICYSETGGESSRNQRRRPEEALSTKEDGATTTTSPTSIDMLALHVSIGTNPFTLLKQAFQEVSDATQTFQTLDHKSIPSSVNDFGWCTWDAFYSKVTPRGILQGVRTLKEGGVPPRKVILDDGWQQVAPYPNNWLSKQQKNGRSVAATDVSSTGLLTSVLNTIVSAVANYATEYYIANVEKAPFGSTHLAIWTILSQTVLKQGLWEFFDSQTDFARQLDGFEPNFKFNTMPPADVDGTVVDDDDEGDDESCSKAPSSLKELVSILKTDLDVKNVYCWHAIHGYWRGVSTKLGHSIGIDVIQVHPKAATHLKKVEPRAAFDPPTLFGVGMITNAQDLDIFYNHIHGPLVEAGVDGVKVDVQSGVTAAASGIGARYGSPPIAKLYTEAMERSVSKHFASSDGTGAINCINCMCHSTENLYRYQTTSIARASEDFFPDKPETHSVHLVNVAYNSLFLGEICLPDWDMFHSKHESAELHAAARAIGGCPVYVSDVPGEHDIDLLRKLVLPDGSVLRAKLPGRPTRDCLFTDVGRDRTSVLKIWNENIAGGGGVVGAFHVQGVSWNFDTHSNDVVDSSPAPLKATVRPHDVDSLRGYDSDAGFAMWSHKSQSLDVVNRAADSIDVILEHCTFELFTIVPIQQVSDGTVQWAPIGLANMMNSGGALQYAGILEQTISKSTMKHAGLYGTDPTESQQQYIRSTTVDITTRGPGQFVAYCQPGPSSILLGNSDSTQSGKDLTFVFDDNTGQLTFDLPPESNGSPHRITVAWDG
jgi:raffinose synthase